MRDNGENNRNHNPIIYDMMDISGLTEEEGIIMIMKQIKNYYKKLTKNYNFLLLFFNLFLITSLQHLLLRVTRFRVHHVGKNMMPSRNSSLKEVVCVC